MTKIIETKINRFDGGMVNDGRDPATNVAQVIQHFDPLTRPHRLVPNVSPEDGNADQTTQGIRQMLYYNGSVFGTAILLSPPAIYKRSDFSGNTWTALTNGADSSGTWNPNVFVEYKGYAYGWRSDTAIWKADLADSVAFVTSDVSIAGVGIQGLIHSKDDILYMPYNVSGGGKIAKNNNGSWTAAAITLPTAMSITSICEYGNFIAIACKPLYFGKSVVYLWDRDSSLTTLSESIDFGVGDLTIIEEIDGYLIGVSLVSANVLFPKVVFRRYSGAGGAQVFKELYASGAANFSLKGGQKFNNRLYFLLGITIAGSLYQGVWAVGRSSTTNEFAVYFSHDPVLSGGSVISSGGLVAFKLIGDYMFIAYSDGADKMSKTNDSPSAASGYNISSIYESQIFNSGDSSNKKDLIGVTVFYDALPANGQIVLKYKIDAETSWTTIFTDGTDNAISHSAINIESSGAKITDFKEIRFRIESTGGAEITGFSFKTEETGKRLYD